MNYTCSRHLGGTATAGPRASGSTYLSHSYRAPHTFCWMEFAVFESFPDVPSLAGTLVNTTAPSVDNLMASTKGAGTPVSMEPIRVSFELFDDESPIACANFRNLCAGESAVPASECNTLGRNLSYYYQNLAASYRGTCVHKIIPGFIIQGGDLTMRLLPSTTRTPTLCSNNQFSGNPTRRAPFVDENKRRRHNEAGLLSMANTGPNTNGTQFFITTSGNHEQALNGRHVCFGRVTSGLERLLKEVAPFGDVNGKPSRYVVVVDCGIGSLPFSSTFSPSSTAPVATAEMGDDGEDVFSPQSTTVEAAMSWREGDPSVSGLPDVASRNSNTPRSTASDNRTRTMTPASPMSPPASFATGSASPSQRVLSAASQAGPDSPLSRPKADVLVISPKRGCVEDGVAAQRAGDDTPVATDAAPPADEKTPPQQEQQQPVVLKSSLKKKDMNAAADGTRSQREKRVQIQM